MSKYHNRYRVWSGWKFGENPPYNRATGKFEPVEPFPGACGDCGKAKEEHLSEWTHEQKLKMLNDLVEESAIRNQQIQNLIEFMTQEMESK